MNNFPRAFSNITRVKILMCLAENDKNVSSLVKKCGLSQSAISQHLKKLKDIGVVDCQIKGRDRLYRLKYPEVGSISENIMNLIKQNK